MPRALGVPGRRLLLVAVLGGLAALLSLLSAPRPALAFVPDPNSGPPGTRVDVMNAFTWPTNRSIEILFQQGSTSTVIGTGTTSSTGTFNIPVTIPSTAMTGPSFIIVRTTGSGPSETDSGQFTVTAGSPTNTPTRTPTPNGTSTPTSTPTPTGTPTRTPTPQAIPSGPTNPDQVAQGLRDEYLWEIPAGLCDTPGSSGSGSTFTNTLDLGPNPFIELFRPNFNTVSNTLEFNPNDLGVPGTTLPTSQSQLGGQAFNCLVGDQDELRGFPYRLINPVSPEARLIEGVGRLQLPGAPFNFGVEMNALIGAAIRDALVFRGPNALSPLRQNFANALNAAGLPPGAQSTLLNNFDAQQQSIQSGQSNQVETCQTLNQPATNSNVRCSGDGVVGGGNFGNSMRWSLLVQAGRVPSGALATVLVPTTRGFEFFNCTPGIAAAATLCVGRTAGTGIQDAMVRVFVSNVQVASGPIHGPGVPPRRLTPPPPPPPPLPLIPPALPLAAPPPVFLPPGPPLPPPVPAGAASQGAPVIPEGGSDALLGIGLAAVGALAGLRLWRRRR
jgi:hypothetical protein